MIDGEDAFGFISILVICFVVVTLIGGFVESRVNTPYAAQDAQNQCIGRGYDVYTWYDRPLFSRYDLGVKCGYVSYEQKDINVDIDEGSTLVLS